MKRSKLVSILILLTMLVVPVPMAAQNPGSAPKVEPAAPPPRTTSEVERSIDTEPPAVEEAWQLGPATPFQWTRFDGAFVPGPDGALWANKVYFMGGRTGGTPAHDNSIWVMDPVAGTYADTGYDMLVNISNYTANVISDDGTGRGPAIYIIGGYNADTAANHGIVQRFYPQTGTVEQLPAADNWTVTVAGYQVGAPGVAVVDDIIYVFGGWESTAAPYFYDGTWAFDPTQPSGSRWTNLGITITPPRAYIQVAAQNGMIYAMGGINVYTGTELDPTPVVEVLDTANLAAGWQARSPMPVAGAEGRGFGFDADTRLMQVPGHLYTVGAADWSAGSAEAMEYLTGPDMWNQAFPDLNEDRRDHAGVYIPTVTADPADGLPGMWVFGGRWDNGDAPPFAPTEYYPLPVAECDVLLVDDDWDQYSGEPYNGTGTAYYTSTLDVLGYNYDRWDVWTQGDPTLADMQGYEAVVWFTGYAWQETITPTNELDLAAYLDGGGNLFLTAYDYLYDQGLTSFGSSYLGIDSNVDDVGEVDPVGTAGDPIGDGLGPYTLVKPTSWPSGSTGVDFADYVYPGMGAAAPFLFNTSGQDNSTRYDGSVWRTAFLGWPLEGLADVNDRADVLGNALSWLCEPRGGGVFLLPNFQEQFVDPGVTVEYIVELANATSNTDTFDITYGGNVWPADVPATVGPVAAGESMTFTVDVQVPGDAVVPFGDLLVVTATSQINPNIVDDATIRTQTVAAVDGHIYDANTGLPLAGYVTIYDNNDPNIGWETWADADGYYSLKDPGFALRSYDMYAAKIGYDRIDTTLTFTGLQTTTVDFWLPAALVEVSPDALQINALEDTSRTVQLSIINNGTADLLFRIDEIAGANEVWPLGANPATNLGVNPKVYEELDTSIDGTAEVLVVMAEQADLSAAYNIADWEARGQYVYNTLKATADRTQAGVRKYLQDTGIEYQSFLSVNALGLTTSKATIEALAAMPEVQAIEPAATFEIPEPILEAGVDAPTAIPWNLANIGADDVWTTFGVTGAGVVVANIDTGVEYTHPALVEQYRGNLGAGVFDHNYNWWDPRGACESLGYDPGEPCDNDSHGTHTMGSMVGSDDPTDPLNATNAIGVAPGAEWIACKGCEYVEGWPCSSFALLECADFIVAPWDSSGANPDPAMRPHIVNNSWGGSPDDGWYFNDALSAWRAAGIFPAFSGGNAGPNCSTSHSPGDYYNSFATGAVNSSDVIASFSSRGPSDLGVQKPQVAAPGSSVRSSVPGNTYANFSGTSMASPHTAGEVALIWSAQPELVGQVWATERLVEQTAMEIFDDQCGPGDRPNYVYGWGRINAFKAVTTALTYEWDVNWLAVEPNMGTVPAGDQLAVDVTVDTTGLTLGECYTAALNVETNDAEQGLIALVPVELCVVDYTLHLAKAAEPLHQVPGMPVVYTLVFSNDGPSDAMAATLLDDLPAEVNFVSADPVADYLAATHQVVWSDLTIAAGATMTATITVNIDAGAAAPATLTNVATLVPELTDPVTASVEHYVDTPFYNFYLPIVVKNGGG